MATVRRHARIIFYLILLLVGVQWVSDPLDERVNPSSELTAAWDDVGDADFDDSHGSGLFLTTDFAF
ncbi:MAG TPA: hypothetical protein VLM91_10575, partial [Candidatus Methylomirabilis sp.]|nr:hypothetical protein [Candidatus Methylomirabilis sp.]